MNAVAFCLFGVDKYKAKHGLNRIREATLLVSALAGGSLGAWLGMRLWHHKTQHAKFRIGLPLIIILQIICVLLLLIAV